MFSRPHEEAAAEAKEIEAGGMGGTTVITTEMGGTTIVTTGISGATVITAGMGGATVVTTGIGDATVGTAEQTDTEHTVAVREQDGNQQERTLRLALLMSVMAAADIGGTGVETGTGPNMVLISLLKE